MESIPVVVLFVVTISAYLCNWSLPGIAATLLLCI